MGRKYNTAVLVGRVDQKSLENLRQKSPVYGGYVGVTVEKINSSEPINNKYQSHSKSRSDRQAMATSGRVRVDDLSDQEYYKHDLDGVVQELLQQHKKASADKESKSQGRLNSQYSRALNSNCINDVKAILEDVIRENYELKQELLHKDNKFLQLQLDQINNNLRKSRPNKHASFSKDDLRRVLEEASTIEKDLKIRLAKVEIDLVEKANMLREAVAGFSIMEEKCERLEAENLFLRKTHDNCVKGLRSRNEVLEKRCEKTDTRRKLEQAGLLEEIRECKWLLRNLTRNVGKCAKLYADARMDMKAELQGRPCKGSGRYDVELGIVEASGLGAGTSSGNRKPDRLTNWLLNVHPKTAQRAMSVWADYLGRRVNHLEDKVIGIKAQKDDIHALQGDGDNCKSIMESEKENSNSEEDEIKLGRIPPSPTWFNICRKAGLNVNPRQEIVVTSDEEDQ